MEENTEYITFEDRAYANPTTSRDEQLSFIDTLRDTQAKNTAQINADTRALGSQLPSNLGGLSGAEDTFVARYQTPQTNQTVANLRLAAQQSALNTALSNLQNAYKKRYNDAMLNYQKRAATAAATSANNTNGNSGLPIDTNTGSGQGVKYDEATKRAYDYFGTGSIKGTESALQQALNAINNGDENMAQSAPFMYRDPITNSVVSGVMYRDRSGNVTGANLRGKEYSASEAMSLLQSLAKEKGVWDTQGNFFTEQDFYTVPGASIKKPLLPSILDTRQPLLGSLIGAING